MIRMVDLAARHHDVAEDTEAAVLSVLRGGHYVGGPVVREVEVLAARWFGRNQGVGVASGTDALMLALLACGVRPSHHVLVPALTFFATAGAVASIGAVPVICDVREDGLLDPDTEPTPHTKAVIPVHLFGNHCPQPRCEAVIIDDAAQAVGSLPPASYGALTAISTYPTKTWGAAGHGGFVVGDDAELVSRLRLLSCHGASGSHHHDSIDGCVGRNSRLDALQAAVLLAHAPRVMDRVQRRRAMAVRYDNGLPSTYRPLARSDGSSVHQYVIRTPQRDRVQAHLRERGIDTAVYYPTPLGRQPALAHAVRRPTPVADALCAELLALPVHAGMSDADVDVVLDALRGAHA